MKITKIFLSFFLLIVSDQFGVSEVRAQQGIEIAKETKTVAYAKALDKKTDSLQRANEKIIPIVDKNSDDILSDLKDLQKKYAARPVKIIYRTRVIHDTIPAEENEYLPNTIYVPVGDTVHDTVIIKQKFHLFNKKHKH